MRDLVWRAGAPGRCLAIGGIRGYRFVLAGSLGGHCRFYPSCSHYAEDAIQVHGVVRGVVLAAWRILRCNPFGAGGVDRVPSRVAAHDAVIRKATVA
ncbi:MAG TPA: membrane protein insertion efficiency factor YidD [Actinomycetota bacterium]|nr:membrane protein insertion efficiency factor YidD [Actinomycetota bacterium]